MYNVTVSEQFASHTAGRHRHQNRLARQPSHDGILRLLEPRDRCAPTVLLRREKLLNNSLTL